MVPQIKSVALVRDFDLSGELDGEIVAPLRKPSSFRQFRLDSELYTVVWPNGADFAPEFL
ncbi:MAG TPA: hypothetical protein VL992_10700 [Tepidisphaeraceae bacterium]|nr:hypothetical protein [Tepidisphaeraceae bacterium]